MDEKEQARKQIQEKLAQVDALISECQTIADEHGVTFDFCVSYGMGGKYVPKSVFDELREQGYGNYWDCEGWQASSNSC